MKKNVNWEVGVDAVESLPRSLRGKVTVSSGESEKVLGLGLANQVQNQGCVCVCVCETLGKSFHPFELQ